MNHDVHSSHPAIIKRLKNAEGHLRSIVAMLEEGRSCLEIAQQLQAVEKAVGSAKKTLIHDHLDNCLDRAVGSGPAAARAPIEEFKAITKYLWRSDDPAGNVWAMNNWQDISSCIGKPQEALSTRCGGQGVTIFYGMAKPVKAPQIGPAQAAN
jgi:DNA-binding FrmR family transcriptional regulator